MKKIIALCSLICVLACGMLFVGCGSSQVSSKSSEKLEASDTAASTSADDPFYVLLVGNDSRLGTTEIDQPAYADGSARSDTIMLVRVDPIDYKVTIMTVPRDTEVTLNGSPNKLNAVYHEDGINALKAQIEELTGADVKYYLDTNFVDFEKLIDALGGVTANVPIDMELDDIVSGQAISLTAGTQELDGKQALVLARVRKAYSHNHEAIRQIQDRNIVRALIEQVAADPSTVDKSVDALLANVETNWSATDLKKTVQEFAQNATRMVIYTATGPYDGTEDSSGMWLATRDEDTWHQIIKAADAGQDPATVFTQPEL